MPAVVPVFPRFKLKKYADMHRQNKTQNPNIYKAVFQGFRDL